MLDYDPDTRHLPQTEVCGLDEFDAEADRVRTELGWSLAVFAAIFDADLNWVLLTQLGDYTKERYGGNLWSLPGGAVLPTEYASRGALRELAEETNLRFDRHDLRPAGWFARPTFKPHFREQEGELLLLFAAIGNPDDPALRPSPPETLQSTFVPYSLESFLTVPTHGVGEHPLQPLPRHWSWWCEAGRLALENQLSEPAVWTYSSREDLRLSPWPVPPLMEPWPSKPAIVLPTEVPNSKHSS